jgi:hypothetical protein
MISGQGSDRGQAELAQFSIFPLFNFNFQIGSGFDDHIRGI